MSVASKTGPTQISRRIKHPIVLGTAVALDAGILLTPLAAAAHTWRPGYLNPDSAGTPDASHIGAYGPPGCALPGFAASAYRADPELVGPKVAEGSSGPTSVTDWTSQATGKPATGHSRRVVEADLVSAKGGA